MADVSAKDVAALRKATGAGMMDCKKALDETDGDQEAAKDWLRKQGLGAAQALRPRGRAGHRRRRSSTATSAALVELLRDRLRRQGRRLRRHGGGAGAAGRGRGRRGPREAAVRGPHGRRARRAARPPSWARRSSSAAWSATRPPTACSTATSTSRTSAARSGSWSSSAAWTRGPEGQEVAHDIALHIAAPRRVSSRRDDVPADVDREGAGGARGEEPQRGQARAATEIVEGRLNGFYKDYVLLEQGFVRPEVTVGKLIEELGPGADVDGSPASRSARNSIARMASMTEPVPPSGAEALG